MLSAGDANDEDSVEAEEADDAGSEPAKTAGFDDKLRVKGAKESMSGSNSVHADDLQYES